MSDRTSAHKPPMGHVSYPTNNPNTTTDHRQDPNPESNRRREMHHEEGTAPNSDDEGIVESLIAPEIGGMYAPLIRLQYQREVENSATVPLPPRVIGGLRDQVEYEQTRSCQCQKSNCLKLYCECFSGGVYCTAYCNCRDCHNYFDGNIHSQRKFDRHEAIKACLEKNPHSFRPGLKNGQCIPAKMMLEEEPPPRAPATTTTTANASTGRSSAKKSDTPCNCTKSRCLKKYCDCFRREEYCSDSCKCLQCMNLPGNATREKIMAAARKKTGGRSNAAQTAAPARASTGRRKAPESSTESGDGVFYLRGNATYPPSYYAVPMKLPSGEASSTLGFGQGLTVKKRKADTSSGNAPPQSAFERAMATEEAVLARRKAEDDAKTATNGTTNAQQQKEQPSLQVQMEQHWNEETRDVLGTFQAMRQELLQRKQDAGLLGVDIVLTREYSYYDLVGSAQLASVELELADVLSSVREAEDKARDLVAKDVQAGRDSSEQGPPAKLPKLSESQRAKIITEATQDTAMMRELARIIRRRALEMSERL